MVEWTRPALHVIVFQFPRRHFLNWVHDWPITAPLTQEGGHERAHSPPHGSELAETQIPEMIFIKTDFSKIEVKAENHHFFSEKRYLRFPREPILRCKLRFSRFHRDIFWIGYSWVRLQNFQDIRELSGSGTGMRISPRKGVGFDPCKQLNFPHQIFI